MFAIRCSAWKANGIVDERRAYAAFFHQRSTQARQHLFFRHLYAAFSQEFLGLQEDVHLNDRVDTALASDPKVGRIGYLLLSQLPRQAVVDQIANVVLVPEYPIEQRSPPTSARIGWYGFSVEFGSNGRFGFQ